MRFFRREAIAHAFMCLALAAATAACSDPDADPSGPQDLVEAPAFTLRSATAPPTATTLPSTWEREDNLHFCGPAAVRIALTTRLGSPPTQAEIGAYLGWDDLANCFSADCPEGSRDLAHVADALRHYLDTDRYEPTYLSTPPTEEEAARLRVHIVDAISAGYPLVVFVYAPGSIGDEDGAYCPAFYPEDGPPHHFLTVIGFEEDGDRAVISDSASGDSDTWGAFPETYSIPVEELARWIGYHGYAG